MKKQLYFLLLSILLLVSQDLFAQNPPGQNQDPNQTQQTQSADTSGLGQRARPGRKADVSISLEFPRPLDANDQNNTGKTPDGRTVYVWQCDPSTGPEYLYLHEPLWGFVEQERPLDSLPSFVRRYLPGMGPEGTDLIEVEFLLSSPEFRELVRNTIINSKAEREKISASGKHRPEEAIVYCVVTNEVALTLIGPAGLETLGFCRQSITSNWGDRAVVTFQMARNGIERLKELNQQQLISLAPQYSFDGFETGTASRTFSANKSVMLAMSSLLDADQQEGTGNVLQSEKTAIEQEAILNARSDLQVSHFQMISALGPSIGVSMMEFLVKKDLTAKDFEAMTGPEAEALAQRLVPLIKKTIESSGGDSSTVTTTSKEKAKETSVQGGVSIGIGPIGISGGAGCKWTDRNIQQLEKSSGISFAKSKESAEYVPQKASVFRAKEGWTKVNVSVTETVTVPLWQGSKIQGVTWVPQTFTAKAVMDRSGKAAEDVLYHGVPLLVPLPYFGDKLPGDNYIWLRPGEVFPNEPWIPEPLRGRPVPDMSNQAFFTGTNNPIGSAKAVAELAKPAGTVSLSVSAVTGTLNTEGLSFYNVLRGNVHYRELAEKSPANRRDDFYVPLLDPLPNDVVDVMSKPNPFNGRDKPRKIGETFSGNRERAQSEWKAYFDVAHLMSPSDARVNKGPDFYARASLQDIMTTKKDGKPSLPVDVPGQTVDITANNLPVHYRANWIMRVR